MKVAPDTSKKLDGRILCCRIFGSVERETGRCFLVAVHDRMSETLIGLIESWIKPGTTVIPDCWKSYERLSERGYHHLTHTHTQLFGVALFWERDNQFAPISSLDARVDNSKETNLTQWHDSSCWPGQLCPTQST
ncbi:DDE_Tnp_IS1595 domain-containing protein [Trichonephila clavipes]|nr:DDE_Tnp_IS1595 domain-containing protein [Trichonephila clavipes]